MISKETAVVTAVGTITDAGDVFNNYSIDWGNTNKDNYEVIEELGTLTVVPVDIIFDLCAGPSYQIQFSGYTSDAWGTAESID